jgi:nicotinate-nucleotide--dimethylbenzimidazole phosphoribosyltransferase
VPARPLDEAAMAAARSAEAAEAGVWLAGCLGTAHPAVRSRAVVMENATVPSVMSVPEVAAAVDAGRALAARSAANGVTVLGVEVIGHRAEVPACALTALLTGRPPSALARGGLVRAVEDLLARHAGELTGPLSALRRVGGEAIARGVGVALGAGEQGLAFVAEGLGATAAVGIALRIEPSLAPRVRLAGIGPTDAEAALRSALELRPLIDGPAGTSAALAVLRRSFSAAG